MNAIKFLFGSLARLPRSAELKRILPGNRAAGAIYAIILISMYLIKT